MPKSSPWKQPLVWMKLFAVALIGIVLLNLWYQSQLRVKITKITTKEQLAEDQASLQNISPLPIVSQSLSFYPGKESELLSNESIKSRLKDINLISFWATWCPTCKTEFPEIKNLQKKWANKDFQVLSINCDTPDMKDYALEMFKGFSLNFPLFFAPEEDTSAQFELEVLPSHLVVNKEGEILMRFEGATNWTDKKIQSLIEEHLK